MQVWTRDRASYRAAILGSVDVLLWEGLHRAANLRMMVHIRARVRVRARARVRTRVRVRGRG